MSASSVIRASVIAAALFGLVLPDVHAAYAAEKTPQEQVTERTAAWFAGRVEFQNHCGACHGMDGKGHGPVAAVMSIDLPDLTQLNTRNGGEFPFDYVAKSIDGRNLPKAHGTLQMPVWGDRYSEGREDRVGETMVHGHIYELMMYLQSIQESDPPSL